MGTNPKVIGCMLEIKYESLVRRRYNNPQLGEKKTLNVQLLGAESRQW